MPSIAEMVEAEAGRAENDEPDEDEQDEPTRDDDEEMDEAERSERDEPEAGSTAAEPPQPETVAALPAIGPDEMGKAERAITAQRRKLAGILGDGYVAHDCPLCSALGFLPELPPAGLMFVAVEDESGMTLLPQAPEPEPDFVEAKDKAACDWCAALGFVLTGSRNPNARVAPCSKCAGNGWVLRPADAAPAGPPALVPALPALAEGASGESLGPDAWGRPAGHVHWGVPPAMVTG